MGREVGLLVRVMKVMEVGLSMRVLKLVRLVMILEVKAVIAMMMGPSIGRRCCCPIGGSSSHAWPW